MNDSDFQRLPDETDDAMALRLGSQLLAERAKGEARGETAKEYETLRQFVTELAAGIDALRLRTPEGEQLRDRLQIWAACVHAGGMPMPFARMIFGEDSPGRGFFGKSFDESLRLVR